MAGAAVEAPPSPSPSPLQLECAVCLQTCVHPVELPCRHIFCYLCVKGVAIQSKRCPMCRSEISPSYLENPTLVTPIEALCEAVSSEGEQQEDEEQQQQTQHQHQQWFYEGRNGWWQYDPRTTQELEVAFKRGESQCELLIAGFLYTIDFEGMFQCRRNEPNRRRAIKRDSRSIPKKGIAGLRLARKPGEEMPPEHDTSQSTVRIDHIPSQSPEASTYRPYPRTASVAQSALSSPIPSDRLYEDGRGGEDIVSAPSTSPPRLGLQASSSGQGAFVLTASSETQDDYAAEEVTEALANFGISSGIVHLREEE